MKDSPQDLEKFVHRTLRSLPNRVAPHTLESRVMAAIAARATQPWWKQSYAQWPLAARCVFLMLSGGFAKLALMATVWAMADFESAGVVSAFTNQFAWVDRLSGIFGGVTALGSMIVRNIPSMWLYSGLACLAVLYGALLGIGATAYRTLFAQR
jgi:hypothetical protein